MPAPVVPVEDRGVGPQADWSRYDVSSSLRVLRTGTDAACRRILRRLHLRWWHAGKGAMDRILRAAGIRSEVLAMIPDIVETCRVCRDWVRPEPRSQPTTTLPDAFNQRVEIDLLFHARHAILHMVDCCTRWHAAREVPDHPTTEDCLKALEELWVHTFGPPADWYVMERVQSPAMPPVTGVHTMASAERYRPHISMHLRSKDVVRCSGSNCGCATAPLRRRVSTHHCTR